MNHARCWHGYKFSERLKLASRVRAELGSFEENVENSAFQRYVLKWGFKGREFLAFLRTLVEYKIEQQKFPCLKFLGALENVSLA